MAKDMLGVESMDIRFGELLFRVLEDGTVALVKAFDYDHTEKEAIHGKIGFSSVELAGGSATGTINMELSDEKRRLRYAGHSLDGNVLSIVQHTPRLEITARFEKYDDTNAVRVRQRIKNISDAQLCLESANTMSVYFGDAVGDCKDWYLHRFNNARYSEVEPDVRSFYDLGFYWVNASHRTLNIGNQSCWEYVPMGLIENRRTGDHMMFQIESYYDWYFEIAVDAGMYYLHMSGPNQRYHCWNKLLAPGQCCETVPVALCNGGSLNDVYAQMTRYRRHIKPTGPADEGLPAIFNEYMHLSWDDPYARRTAMIAPHIARTGCKYYVIDCGWHDDVPPSTVYRHFGTWFESRMRFPEGIRKTADLVHSLGMKFGLWISPEVVGKDNARMLEYYPREAFLLRNGERIANSTGYLLDYRHPKVIEYMSATFDRMVNEYGVDYIKFDGPPSAGPGTDNNASSLGDGLEQHIEAFLKWVEDMMKRYPNVIFEDCAGGGQRLDYRALSMFHLASTSDQTNYLKYPYIVGNIFCAVLPEQAAVWSYPVDSMTQGVAVYDREHEELVDCRVSTERVVMNMINSLLGRIHLASRVQLLSEEKQALIREGVALYNAITPDKLESTPYMPLGYTRFGDTLVSVGIKTEKKLYLGVWNLHGERHVKLELPEISVKSARVAYPTTLETTYSCDATSLTIDFTEDEQARLFEMELA